MARPEAPIVAEPRAGRMLTRVGDIADGGGEQRGKYAEYTYLGPGIVTKLKYPQAGADGLAMTLDPCENETFLGLDRFGRVVDLRWRTDGQSPAVKDRFAYGYDRNSNRLFRRNLLDANFSELYHANGASSPTAYDGLDRLKEFRRGELNGGNSVIAAGDTDARQLFSLDALGNWTHFKDGNGTAWSLEQTRKHNKANEIDVDDNHANVPGDSISGNWADPEFDAAGNLTSGPSPAGEAGESVRRWYIYDAWNRLVTAAQGSSGTPVFLAHEYDGLHRRIERQLQPAYNYPRYHYYYNTSWQVLQTDRTLQGTTTVHDRYVWDLRYIDSPILRWCDNNADGDFADANEVLYYTNDAQYNVTALVNTGGKVVERYRYDPYGKATVLNGEADAEGAEWTVDAAGDWSNELLYCGYRLDPTGLYHVRHRMYHPTLGRWMQRDFEGYLDGMNLHAYICGAPTRLSDPTGLDAGFSTLLLPGQLDRLRQWSQGMRPRPTGIWIQVDNSAEFFDDDNDDLDPIAKSCKNVPGAKTDVNDYATKEEILADVRDLTSSDVWVYFGHGRGKIEGRGNTVLDGYQIIGSGADITIPELQEAMRQKPETEPGRSAAAPGLVILAACDTCGSLTDAFLKAGSRCVMCVANTGQIGTTSGDALANKARRFFEKWCDQKSTLQEAFDYAQDAVSDLLYLQSNRNLRLSCKSEGDKKLTITKW